MPLSSGWETTERTRPGHFLRTQCRSTERGREIWTRPDGISESRAYRAITWEWLVSVLPRQALIVPTKQEYCWEQQTTVRMVDEDNRLFEYLKLRPIFWQPIRVLHLLRSSISRQNSSIQILWTISALTKWLYLFHASQNDEKDNLWSMRGWKSCSHIEQMTWYSDLISQIKVSFITNLHALSDH